MIYIQSKLRVADNSGGKIVKCINVIGKSKIAKIGQIILVCLSKLVNNKKVKKKIIYLGLIISIQY
jgi:large subunit ribosomal protein L14